jgi:hypothetical protein
MQVIWKALIAGAFVIAPVAISQTNSRSGPVFTKDGDLVLPTGLPASPKRTWFGYSTTLCCARSWSEYIQGMLRARRPTGCRGLKENR